MRKHELDYSIVNEGILPIYKHFTSKYILQFPWELILSPEYCQVILTTDLSINSIHWQTESLIYVI